MEKSTWINGPKELLEHGFEHIELGTDFDLRIAMISIDNATELAIKTYIAKNRRSLKISRKEYKDIKKNFPILLDALERYAGEEVSEEELDMIEHFHSIRNSLYHEGNGISVKKDIVDLYAVIAKELINRLFNLNDKKFVDSEEYFEILGDFMKSVKRFEYDVFDSAFKYGFDASGFDDIEALDFLEEAGLITRDDYNKFFNILEIRNNIFKDNKIPDLTILKEALGDIKYFQMKLQL